jgi:peptidoglycan/LPS O-acetylase OafA/YrhL
MSFPSNFPESAPWSKFLHDIGRTIFPTHNEPPRVWGTVGAIMLVVAIMISPHIRSALSTHVLLWLGKISFPIYLLHGTFLRTIFAWIMFAGKSPRQFEVKGANGESVWVDRYPQPGPFGIWVAVAVSMGLCLLTCDWWSNRVEPLFGKMTKWAEELTFKKGDGAVERANGIPLNAVAPTTLRID